VRVKCLQVVEEPCEDVCSGDVTRKVQEVDVVVDEEVAEKAACIEDHGPEYCR
jgi:hypothetical protein